MKHAVIVARPNPNSLTSSPGAAYAQSVKALGQEVFVRDLYLMRFDPCLSAIEIPTASGSQFAADVVSERQELVDVDVFAFVYPFRFNSPLAILNGYVDRVFSMGFGYEAGMGGTESLLDRKKLISISTSGAPDQRVRESGALQTLMNAFDRHLAAMCGLQVVDHVHAGGIVSDLTPEAADDVLRGVRRAVRAHVGDPARRAPALRTGA